MLFSSDPDFSARMFDRQLAVMKGQGGSGFHFLALTATAYAIVQTLLSEDEGASASVSAI